MHPKDFPADRLFPGACAWSFDDWRGVFYPESLPKARWLEHYAGKFPAVEMDSTFYHLPSMEVASHWCEMTAPGFRFCPKVPKALSHEKRLADPQHEIGLIRRLADLLGPRFGCALLQLPPSFRASRHEEKHLREFLRAWPQELRLAVEFRDGSWETPHAARCLEDHGAAWVWADNHPLEEQQRSGFGFLPVTAPHLYLRLLGDFRTEYGPDGGETHRCGRKLWSRETALEHWAVKLRHHADASAVFAFANNHFEGMAVDTIRRLADLLGCKLPEPGPGASPQLELFDGTPPA